MTVSMQPMVMLVASLPHAASAGQAPARRPASGFNARSRRLADPAAFAPVTRWGYLAAWRAWHGHLGNYEA